MILSEPLLSWLCHASSCCRNEAFSACMLWIVSSREEARVNGGRAMAKMNPAEEVLIEPSHQCRRKGWEKSSHSSGSLKRFFIRPIISNITNLSIYGETGILHFDRHAVSVCNFFDLLSKKLVSRFHKLYDWQERTADGWVIAATQRLEKWTN